MMTQTMSMAVMEALIIALIAYSKDSGCLDAAQESVLMAAVAEGNWQEIERICTDWKAMHPKSSVSTRLHKTGEKAAAFKRRIEPDDFVLR